MDELFYGYEQLQCSRSFYHHTNFEDFFTITPKFSTKFLYLDFVSDRKKN